MSIILGRWALPGAQSAYFGGVLAPGTPGVLSWATAAGEAMRLVSPLARGKYPSRSSLGEISLLRLLESCAAPLATPCTTRSAVAAANLRALDCVLRPACSALRAPPCMLWTACSALRAPPCVLWTACSALHAPPCVLWTACSALRAPPCVPRRGRLCQAADATAHCLLELSHACSPPCFCSARLVCSRAVSSAASPRLGSSRCLSCAWLVTVLISSGVLIMLLFCSGALIATTTAAVETSSLFSSCCLISCLSSPWLVTIPNSSCVLIILLLSSGALVGGRLGTSNSGEQQEAAGSQGPRR